MILVFHLFIGQHTIAMFGTIHPPSFLIDFQYVPAFRKFRTGEYMSVIDLFHRFVKSHVASPFI